MTSETGTFDNPIRYVGEYYDAESGNIYLRARYYDPTCGRFLSEDPVKDGANWYSYCGGNPVNFVDFWGLWAADGSDERFKESNPIVYSALAALSDTWLKLEALKGQSHDPNIDIDQMQRDVGELADFVRTVGDAMVVSVPLWISGHLNDVEKVIYAWNPQKGYEVFMAGNEARTKTGYYYGDAYSVNGNSDAFRHAYWNALATSLVGSEYTRLFTNAHEYGFPENFDNTHLLTVTYMDLFNNGIGRYQANLLGGLGVGELPLQNAILNNIANGGMWRVLVDYGPLVNTDGSGRIR